MLPEAREAGARVTDYLRECLERSAVADLVYAQRLRVKKESGIEEKIHRKRNDKKNPKSDYSWQSITDIIGLRYITLYRDDIAPVTECVLRSLLGEGARQPSAFERPNLEEFILYLSNTHLDSDPLHRRLDSIARAARRTADKWTYRAETGERYSSVHFVSWLPKTGDYRIPIEIQIRSVFEDAWGEIDHPLLYEPTRADDAESAPSQMERMSSALKKMMDAAADFADIIRNVSAPEAVPAVPIRPTLDDADYIQRVCDLLSVPAETKAPLMQLVRLKDELDAKYELAPAAANREEYSRLADSFAELVGDLLHPGGYLHGTKAGDEAREVLYIARMEEAVCRLLSYEVQQVPVAIRRLNEVTAEFSDHPVAWLRLGEACARYLDIVDRGSELDELERQGSFAYERAAEELAGLGRTGDRERYFAASPRQEAYIHDHLGRMHAYLVWRAEGRRRGDAPADASALKVARRAAGLSLQSVQVAKDEKAKYRALNSFVYYAAEAMDIADHLRADPELPSSTEELRAALIELEAQAPNTGRENVLRIWDTIGYARFKLDGAATARAAAQKVMLAHAAGLAGGQSEEWPIYLREQEAKAVRRALQFLEIGQ